MVELIRNQCPKMTDILGEKILIFGGSGSLGTEVINTWISNNKIMNVSRNEDKQWNLKMKIKNSNLEQMIGDISQENDVSNAILTYKPTIICIFACLKHIDLCEKNPEKTISNNTNGIINVHKTKLGIFLVTKELANRRVLILKSVAISIIFNCSINDKENSFQISTVAII